LRMEVAVCFIFYDRGEKKKVMIDVCHTPFEK